MSADEIRRLAEPLCRDRAVSVYNESLDEFIADGCVTLKYRDALLAYAAMVERCEELLADHKSYVEENIEYASFYQIPKRIEEINYILRGDARKEEK